MTCTPGALQRLDRDEVGHVDAERLACEPALAKLVRDLLAQPVGDPGLDRHRAAHRRDARAEVLGREPRGEELVMAGSGTEVPEDRVVAAREEREARVLVARPLADVRARDVADVVRVEEQQRPEVGCVERRLRRSRRSPRSFGKSIRCSQSTARVASGEPLVLLAVTADLLVESTSSLGRQRSRLEDPQMEEERHEIVVSVACLDRGAEERLDLPRQRQLDAGGLSRVEHEVDVLLHQGRGERSRVVVAQQRLGLVLDERRADGRVAHRLEQRSPGDTGRLPENERLGHQLREPGDDKVDRELHDASLLRVADDVDGRADRAQHRLGVGRERHAVRRR